MRLSSTEPTLICSSAQLSMAAWDLAYPCGSQPFMMHQSSTRVTYLIEFIVYLLYVDLYDIRISVFHQIVYV